MECSPHEKTEKITATGKSDLGQSTVQTTHCFDPTAGRKIDEAMRAVETDDAAKRTNALKLHDHPHVQQLLLQRCGIIPRWLDGKRASSFPAGPDSTATRRRPRGMQLNSWAMTPTPTT